MEKSKVQEHICDYPALMFCHMLNGATCKAQDQDKNTNTI